MNQESKLKFESVEDGQGKLIGIKDTPKAAVLMAKGSRLQQVDRSNPESIVFKFEYSSKVEEVLVKYSNWELEVNAHKFVNRYQYLKGLIHNRN